MEKSGFFDSRGDVDRIFIEANKEKSRQARNTLLLWDLPTTKNCVC